MNMRTLSSVLFIAACVACSAHGHDTPGRVATPKTPLHVNNAYGGIAAVAACGLDHEEVTGYTDEDGGWDPTAALVRTVRLSAQASSSAAGVPGYAASEEQEGEAAKRTVFIARGGGGVASDLPLLPCLVALRDAGADIAAGRNRLTMESALDLAAGANDAWLSATLVTQGANANAVDRRGLTSAMYALHKGANDAARVLVEHPSTKLEQRIKGHGVTMLMVAVQANNTRGVQLLLDAGVRIDAQDDNGITALGKAAAMDLPHIVQQLADAGASLSIRDKNGVPPLVAAIRKNATLGVGALLDAGADGVGAFFKDGATPLLYAASVAAPRAIIRRLLDAGADPNAPTEHGTTALIQAVQTCSSRVIMDLVKAGGKLNTRVRGKSLLAIAVRAGRAGAAAALLALGADVNAPVDEKWMSPPLHMAAVAGHLPTVKVLLKAGAELTAGDKVQHTALHWAAYEGHVNVTAFLLKKGVPIDAKNADGMTAAMLAAQTGSAGVLSVLADGKYQGGANFALGDTKHQRTPLHMAALGGHTAAVEAIIEGGADVNATDRHLWTALSLAAKGNHRDTVLSLLRLGAGTRVFYPDDTGLLPEDVVLDDDEARMAALEGGVVPDAEVDTHLCLSLALRARHWDRSAAGKAHAKAARNKARGTKSRTSKTKSNKSKKPKKSKKSKKGGKGGSKTEQHTPWDVAVPVCIAEFAWETRPFIVEVANAVCGFAGSDALEPSPPCGVNGIRLPLATVLVNPGGMLPRKANPAADALNTFAQRYFGDHKHGVAQQRVSVNAAGMHEIDTREVMQDFGITLDHLEGKTPEEISEIFLRAQHGDIEAARRRAFSQTAGGPTAWPAQDGSDEEDDTTALGEAGAFSST